MLFVKFAFILIYLLGLSMIALFLGHHTLMVSDTPNNYYIYL